MMFNSNFFLTFLVALIWLEFQCPVWVKFSIFGDNLRNWFVWFKFSIHNVLYWWEFKFFAIFSPAMAVFPSLSWRFFSHVFNRRPITLQPKRRRAQRALWWDLRHTWLVAKPYLPLVILETESPPWHHIFHADFPRRIRIVEKQAYEEGVRTYFFFSEDFLF